MARGPGDVGCAHCTRIGADRPCQVCTHLICETCAANWATCSEPSGRVVRLGLTARLRDVDPTGRLGLVSHWRKPMRLFDLRRLRWIRDVYVRRSAHLWNRAHPARLTGNGHVIYADWVAGSGYERSSNMLFSGIRVAELRSDHSRLVGGIDAPVRGTAVSASRDIFYYVTDTERVGVIDGATGYSVEPMPRKVLHAVYIDGERDLLAAGSWAEIVLCGLVDGRLAPLSRGKTETTGDVIWIAVAGPWLVSAVKVFASAAIIEVRRLERDLTLGPVIYRHSLMAMRGASLSRDGRYLALATQDGLLVQSLDTGDSTVFTEHTDKINLVRFAGDDHMLISADTDNRVVLRPRTPTGYARPLIALDVPDDGVELPPLEAAPVAVA